MYKAVCVYHIIVHLVSYCTVISELPTVRRSYAVVVCILLPTTVHRRSKRESRPRPLASAGVKYESNSLSQIMVRTKRFESSHTI